MMEKSIFIGRFLPLAVQTEELFGVNRVAVLAQCAVESGWGGSSLAARHHNYFGIVGYGCCNAYWKGRKSEPSRSGLVFRSYDSPADSFFDFGRLISSAYQTAAAVSHIYGAYAHEIAYSPYISEQNGDCRSSYKRMITSICNDLDKRIKAYEQRKST